MMKKALFLLAAIITGTVSMAQLTGTKNIPGDYATVAAAIADLNTQGVGTGGVTFNIATTHTETFPSVTSGRITTQTGSQANPIIFQRNGISGNPTITAALQALGQGTARDAILCIYGCDYVTIDGLKLLENSGNNNQNRRMEWGIAILKPSGANGSQNITIKNCIITLNKLNLNTKAIYSNNHTVDNTSPLVVTSFSGTNSNLKIFSNTITNSYTDIYLMGFPDLSAYYDQNNEVGVNGANIITNVGGDWDVAYGIYGKYQSNIKVANNNITSNTATGTGSLYGIYLTSATNANYDLYGNYISLQYSPSNGNTASFYGIHCDLGENGSSNVVNIYNNTVTNCYYSGVISAEIRFINLLNLGVTANIYGNVVSSNTIVGSTTIAGNSTTRYLYCQKSSSVSGALVAHDNQVLNNTNIYTSPYFNSGVTFYMAFLGSGTTLECYNNSIHDNYAGTVNAIYGLYVYFNDDIYKNIYSNTIKNIYDANGGFSGIYIGNGTLTKVYKNFVQNINSSLEGVSVNITGIHHVSGNLTYYYNNMISDLNNRGSVSTEGYDYNTLNGFYVDQGDPGTIKGFYSNTVYLNSPTISTDFGSSAFCTLTLYGIDLRNNIFVNTSANAGNGKTAGIRSRSEGFTGYSSNYNCIYAGSPGANNLLFTDGTSTAQNLLQYRTLVTPQELQSVTELPHFINVTTQPYDVHLQTGVATQCEAGGVVVMNPVAVTTDFDSQARYPNAGYPVNPTYPPAAPDIGADEFGGVRSDITAPAIVYTPLGNTPSGSARTLIARITDGTGVPTSGNGRPRLYWKKNSGSWTGVYGTSNGGGNYSFVFGGSSTTGDVISYYVVAQDLVAPTPNIGAYPWIGASGFTHTPPACTTPPTTPYTYTIVPSISGTYHVGVGKTYTTLTAAVNDLNLRGLTGPLTFILDDNAYPSETYPIVFYPNGGSSVTNTVTIKPNTGATPVLTGSMAGSALIMFKGIDHVTFDGSNSGGTDKNLTIQNTSSTSNACTLGITTNGTDGSSNITIKNCVLKGENSDILVSTYIIVFNQDGGLTGGRYNNCLIENNTIIKAKHAIWVQASSYSRNNKIQIINNTIGSANSNDYITRWGIAVSQSDSTTISGNEIMGPAEGVALESLWGIYAWDNATNTKILKNKIHDWIAQGRSSIGIKFDLDIPDPPPTEISNNVIYNIGCYGLNPGINQSIPYGIFIRSGGNVRMWHNSIYLSGPYLAGNDTYAPSSACIGLYDYTTDQFDIRNNILRNSMTNPFPNPGPDAMGKAYGIMVEGGAEIFDAIDNNDYFIDGYQGQIAQYFQTGLGNLIDFPTLTSWQNYILDEENSMDADPLYLSTSDLHLQTGSPAIGMAVPITQITTDYVGNPRSATFPTIGAYEYTYTLPANVVWTGMVSTNWSTKGNWLPTVVPVSTIDALIPSSPTGGHFPVVPATGSPFNVKSLTVQTGATVTLQAGSTLNVTNN